MPATKLDLGLQLHLPSYRDIPLRQLLRLAQVAHAGGMQQLWVTDNLQSRNAFVVLAALAGTVPVSLGTAVVVQYFRNPVDVADAAAAIGELMDGRELSLGLSRGNPGTPNLVRSVKPVSMLRETAQALQQLLAGEPVQFCNYPTIASYFNLVPERSFQLNFRSSSPVRLYCGGNAPRSLAVGGATMDGIVFGWTFLAAARSGRLRHLLHIADEAAREAGRPTPVRKVAEIKIYVTENDQTARSHCKHAVASRMAGLFERDYTTEEFQRLGIPGADIERLFQATRSGATSGALSEFVTDAMIDALFVAGDPAHCREQLRDVCDIARQYGFEQLMFSELGPDVDASLRLLCDKIVPSL